MKLEVIASSVADVYIAEQNGADRIELISGIKEGGVTPSYGLITQAVKATSLPVNVMIRPHANSFVYTQEDVAVMKEDIHKARELGAAGIVIGALTAENKINIPVLETLLAEAGDLSVTFHRALDEVEDQMQALQLLQKFPAIDRVLTSGGEPSALNAKSKLKQMAQWSREHGITILAGSGLTLETLEEFIRETGVQEVHMGTGVRVEGNPLAQLDPNKVRLASEILRNGMN